MKQRTRAHHGPNTLSIFPLHAPDAATTSNCFLPGTPLCSNRCRRVLETEDGRLEVGQINMSRSTMTHHEPNTPSIFSMHAPLHSNTAYKNTQQTATKAYKNQRTATLEVGQAKMRFFRSRNEGFRTNRFGAAYIYGTINDNKPLHN